MENALFTVIKTLIRQKDNLNGMYGEIQVKVGVSFVHIDDPLIGYTRTFANSEAIHIAFILATSIEIGRSEQAIERTLRQLLNQF